MFRLSAGQICRRHQVPLFLAGINPDSQDIQKIHVFILWEIKLFVKPPITCKYNILSINITNFTLYKTNIVSR
jgi:hypothetical protein